MAGQGKHFGTDLAQGAPTASAILAFLLRTATGAAGKFNRSVPPAATLR